LLGIFRAALDWLLEEADRGHHSGSRNILAFGGGFELLDVDETHHRGVFESEVTPGLFVGREKLGLAINLSGDL